MLIDQQAIEHELDWTFVGALIRLAYGKGYLAALADENASLEQTAVATSALYCRLPV